MTCSLLPPSYEGGFCQITIKFSQKCNPRRAYSNRRIVSGHIMILRWNKVRSELFVEPIPKEKSLTSNSDTEILIWMKWLATNNVVQILKR